MRTINEFLNSKPSGQKEMVKATNFTLKDIIKNEFNRVGPAADLNFIDVSEVTIMNGLFQDTDFQGDLENWNTSNVKSMKNMFNGCSKFNSDLSRWDVRQVEDMEGMFSGCEKLSSDFSNWEPKSLKYAKHMFFKCFEFNSDLSAWPIEKCTDFTGMFYMCKKLSYGMPNWKIVKTASVYSMFYKCSKLNFKMKNNNWQELVDNQYADKFNYMITGAGFTKNNLPDVLIKFFKIKK